MKFSNIFDEIVKTIDEINDELNDKQSKEKNLKIENLYKKSEYINKNKVQSKDYKNVKSNQKLKNKRKSSSLIERRIEEGKYYKGFENIKNLDSKKFKKDKNKTNVSSGPLANNKLANESLNTTISTIKIEKKTNNKNSLIKNLKSKNSARKAFIYSTIFEKKI